MNVGGALRGGLLCVVCASILASSARAAGRDIAVPFVFFNDSIVVTAELPGLGTAAMLLDTAVDPSLIDLAKARALGLPLPAAGERAAGGGTGTNPVYDTRLPPFGVGDLRSGSIAALAVDLSGTSRALGRTLDGVLGYSFLAGRIVRIDYPKRVVHFLSASPAARSAERDRSRRTVLSFRYRDDILIGDVFVDGKKVIANLDTGSNNGLQLTPAAIERLGLEAEAAASVSSRSTGINGATENRKGKLRTLRIASLAVDAPSVIFLGRGMGHDDEPWELRIGNAFLKDYIVTIDYRRRVIELERPR